MHAQLQNLGLALGALLFTLGAPVAAAAQAETPAEPELPAPSSVSASDTGQASKAQLSAQLEAEPETRREAPPAERPAAAPRRLPVPLAARPLTLPKGHLRVDVDVQVARQGFEDPFVDLADDTFTFVRAGGAFGITDNLEVGALVLPLQLSPDVEYRDIALYGTYRLLATHGVEIGARADVVIPTETDFTLAASLPVLLRVGDRLRIDTGAQMVFAFRDPTVVGLGMVEPGGPLYPHPLPVRSLAGIPLIANLNLTDCFYVGARTGFTVVDFDEFDDSIIVPLGAQVGYTIEGGERMLADITARFEFPWFGSSGPGDTINTDFWQATLAGNLYFDIL